MSHFAAIYLYCSPHYAVSHHKNAITPTPPQLLLIATDKSSMWHVHDTLPNFNQTTVAWVRLQTWYVQQFRWGITIMPQTRKTLNEPNYTACKKCALKKHGRLNKCSMKPLNTNTIFTFTPSPCGLSDTFAMMWWRSNTFISRSVCVGATCVLGQHTSTPSSSQLICKQVEPETCWLVRGKVIRPGGAAVVPTEKHMSGINTYSQDYRLAHLDH